MQWSIPESIEGHYVVSFIVCFTYRTKKFKEDDIDFTFMQWSIPEI